MLAVFKREFGAYFHTMTGYVFLAFLFVVVGIYFTAYNLGYGYPLISYSLASAAFTMLITTPMLSMRVLAEERRQKVDQLLLTSPVPVYQLVLGKYLAMAAMFAVPVLVFCLYPVILSSYGSLSFAQSYTSLLGFYLMGCACLAIGLYVSSLTENQVIAAVGSFGILVLFYLMSGIESLIPTTAGASFLCFTVLLLAAGGLIYRATGSTLTSLLVLAAGEAVLVVVYVADAALYEGSIQRLLSVFDLSSRFGAFTGAVFDLTAAVYFLTVAAAGIFLTVQSIQRRRWR